MSSLHQSIKSALVTALILSASTTFANKDLFGNDPAGQHSSPAQELITAPVEETEEEPALSPTDAAQRAQHHVDGQVMNVRKFREENKTLYGVKVLQKSGRMKTVNVDANSGAIVE